jgi:hypothetical protein
MENARNLNYVLGSIGNALQKLGKLKSLEIPPIQCLVINKATKLPGNGVGWFISKEDFSKLPARQKREVVKQQLVKIFAFRKWDWVLSELKLIPLKYDLSELISSLGQKKGSGGESEAHKKFKEYISNNPSVIGLNNKLLKGKIEVKLPSADQLDVLFVTKKTKIGVEVKSIISDTTDIYRGLFQCVKYKCLIEAEQAVKGERPDGRTILALEGKLPK